MVKGSIATPLIGNFLPRCRGHPGRTSGPSHPSTVCSRDTWEAAPGRERGGEVTGLSRTGLSRSRTGLSRSRTGRTFAAETTGVFTSLAAFSGALQIQEGWKEFSLISNLERHVSNLTELKPRREEQDVPFIGIHLEALLLPGLQDINMLVSRRGHRRLLLNAAWAFNLTSWTSSSSR